MKKLAITITAILTVEFSFAQSDGQKVDALLKQMTLEEKVGQMTQVTLAVVAKGGWGNQDGSLDPAALKKAIEDYKVGSILNTTAHAFDVNIWRNMMTQIQDATKNTRLKIPVIYGLDGIHGQTYTLNSTLFPQSIAMAATRDTALAKKATKITAMELRASGVRWNFAPVLDCGRQQLWSRFPETYGEDVLMGKIMGSVVVRAYEEDGLKNPTAVASCMKHYLGYSASRTGKDRTPAYMPEIELREYYLPQFQAAVKAGASTVMINSGEINGVPVHASKYLLIDVLRKELGFEGVIVTDWEDIKRLHERHFVASTPEKAVAMAINAGIDMSMVPGDFSFYDLLLEAVKKGDVPMSRVDDAVRRILTLKMKVGLFDNPYPEDVAANFGKPEYQQVALDAAHQSMTLLKNSNNILPLQKNVKVLVEGPSAQSLSALNGCWSYTWQGNQEQHFPAGSKTIFEAIADKVGASNVSTTTAVKDFDNAKNYDTAALRTAAANADVIVLCLGENAYAESPGNTTDLALPDNQIALAKVAASTGKPVILVLTEGRPRFITTIEPGMKGILMAYWSGRKTAEAVADVLFGDYNPDGILPFSYERSMGEMVLYDRKPTEDVREIFNENMNMSGYSPLYPFGFGLSYTTFQYSDIQLSANTLSGNAKLTVNVTITNSGSRDGKHAVELYTRQHYASITPSMRRLRAFQKIFLKAGENKTVTFTLDKNDLAFVNADLKTVTEPGDFDVMIGDKKAVFSYK